MLPSTPLSTVATWSAETAWIISSRFLGIPNFLRQYPFVVLFFKVFTLVLLSSCRIIYLLNDMDRSAWDPSTNFSDNKVDFLDYMRRILFCCIVSTDDENWWRNFLSCCLESKFFFHCHKMLSCLRSAEMILCLEGADCYPISGGRMLPCLRAWKWSVLCCSYSLSRKADNFKIYFNISGHFSSCSIRCW